MPFQDIMTFQQLNSYNHPMEDRFAIAPGGAAMAVADGVTRIRYPDGPPGYSGSALAAELFCNTVVEYLEECRRCNDRTIHSAFNEANAAIKMLNEASGIDLRLDYVENDYYAAVGAAVLLCENGHLHYGYIGDCRVMVIGRDYTPRLLTDDDVQAMKSYLYRTSQREKLRDRAFVHSVLRNNSAHVDELGNRVSYGTLTGEESVEQFYRTAHIDIDDGDLVLLFSDGISPLLERGELLSMIERGTRSGSFDRLHRELVTRCARLSAQNPVMYGDDKTLMLSRIRRYLVQENQIKT